MLLQITLDLLGLVPVTILGKMVAKNLKVRSRQYFLATLIGLGFWGILDALITISPDSTTTLLFRIILMIDLSFSALFLFMTGITLTKRNILEGIIVGSIPFILFFVSIPYIHMVPGNGRFVPEPNMFLDLWQLSILFVFLSLPLVIRKTYKTVNNDLKRKLRWFELSIVLAALSGIIMSQLTFNYGFPYLASLAGSLSLLPAIKAFQK